MTVPKLPVGIFLCAVTAGVLFYHSQRSEKKDAPDQSSRSLPNDKKTTTSRGLPKKEGSLTNLAKELSQEVSLAEKFPCLAEPLKKAPVIGLYFCAGWCGDCSATTPALAKVVACQQDDDQVLVHIVYVSSDMTHQEMLQNKPAAFSHVPWNGSSRADLKRHFQTCAGKERQALGMSVADRKHGTPTLILLDAASGWVLTDDGATQVETMEPSAVLDKWKNMFWGVHGNDSWETVVSAHYQQPQK